MKVTVLGINHKSAPISLREKLVFDHDAITQSLNEFKKKFNSGVVILSTCNRTEIYSTISDRKEIEIWLSKHHSVKISELGKHTYFFSKIEALKHAAAVGAGLDSMIIGEPQVLGQIKQAFKVSQNVGLIDQSIILFFNKVFELSKIIRTKTQIGTNSTTIASTALKLILKIFGELKQLSILFIGAGEMNELCAKYFAKHNPKKIMIANRTLQRAEQLGKKINGHSCLIGDVNKIIHHYDVVVSCTGSQLPIIGLGMIEEAIEQRKHQPMFFVDLAIPADIEKEIENLDDTFLYNLEDLAKIAQEGITMREQELVNAYNLLEDLIESFAQNKKNENISLTIALKTYFDHVQENELKKALKEIKNGSEADQVCKKLARNLTNKLLHHPTKSLNENKKYAQIIKEIFNLKD
jgi:glutamyl-tRNA reductase